MIFSYDFGYATINLYFSIFPLVWKWCYHYWSGAKFFSENSEWCGHSWCGLLFWKRCEYNLTHFIRMFRNVMSVITQWIQDLSSSISPLQINHFFNYSPSRSSATINTVFSVTHLYLSYTLFLCVSIFMPFIKLFCLEYLLIILTYLLSPW